MTVGVGREPLETVETPGVAVRCRSCLELREVAAAGALGQRLDGLARPLSRRELGQNPLADVGRCELAHQVDDHLTAGAQRTGHPDLGLVE